MTRLFLNRIYLGIMFSYIVVLLIPTGLLGTLIISQVRSALEEEYRDSALTALDQARQTIDTRMTELDEMSYQISSNRFLRQLFNAGESAGPERYFTIADFTRDFAGIASVNKFIADPFVYLKEERMFLSPVTNYSADLIYKSYGPRGLSYEAWLRELDEVQSGQLRAAVETGFVGGNGTRSLVYTRTIQVQNQQATATLLAYIREDKIRALFESDPRRLKGAYYIVDQNGEVIFSTDPDHAILGTPMLQEETTAPFASYELAGKRYTAVAGHSQVRGWSYYSVIEQEVLMGKVNVLQRTILAVMAICLVLGLVLALLLSRQNYRPIKRIIASMNKGGKAQQPQAIDYSTLIERIEETYDKKSELELQLRQQIHTIRSNFIKKLLLNQYANQGEIDRMQEVLNIRWKSSSFNVVLLHIDDFVPFEQAQGNDPLELIRLIITNIAEELFNRRHLAFAYEEDGRITLLVNYSDTEEAGNERETREILSEMIPLLRDRFKIGLSAGGGNICVGLEGIPGAWAEAKLALSQRMLHGKYSLTMYREIPVSSNSYYYPFDTELQIMNHVRIGNYEGAEQLLDIVYEENYVKRRLPVYLVNCLFFDMVGTIVKVLDSIQANHEDVFGEHTDMVATLMRCETVADMHQEIKRILRKVCAYIEHRRESNNSSLREQMIAYIDDHYADKNLSLLMAAEHFGMSSSYLSRFFKDQTGYNFIDYVTRLRIQKAKELLASGEGSITEIADKVGYGSANSFIRSFKKQESITPGQYKEGQQ